MNNQEKNIKEISNSIYKELGLDIEKDELVMSKLENLDATLVYPKDRKRGVGDIIVGSDGTFLVCGSLHSTDFYIKEFQLGKRSNMVISTEEVNKYVGDERNV